MQEQKEETAPLTGGPVDRIVRCKDCGGMVYEIRMIYHGRQEELLVVECDRCRSEYRGHLIPVVVPSIASQKEINSACLSAWNDAQEKPNI